MKIEKQVQYFKNAIDKIASKYMSEKSAALKDIGEGIWSEAKRPLHIGAGTMLGVLSGALAAKRGAKLEAALAGGLGGLAGAPFAKGKASYVTGPAAGLGYAALQRRGMAPTFRDMRTKARDLTYGAPLALVAEGTRLSPIGYAYDKAGELVRKRAARKRLEGQSVYMY